MIESAARRAVEFQRQAWAAELHGDWHRAAECWRAADIWNRRAAR